ncbi:hypothetical protein NBO_43gi001 [Nosema bombycis CQ1]|uniref:Rho-GAP domain-containing protein n=1 Tax=Nosema bombycis (strain CQ1 / CVCC 102059) TaxID=578461 RepID=R0KT73_NOSB1|nr:hypothetical protein NBO_43gi001 [Nosema bombycis CQ1]|eukprot:EOB13996.1 hypothetical protein NBO_43gi001 [Nosema bombycis CQ1]
MSFIKSIISMITAEFRSTKVFYNYKNNSTKSDVKATSDDCVFFNNDESVKENKINNIKNKIEKKLVSVLEEFKDSWINKKEFVDPNKKVYKQTDKIFIKDLSEVEVNKLRNIANRKFVELQGKGVLTKILNRNRKLVIEHRDINPYVFKIIKHVKPFVGGIKYIFRLEDKSKNVLRYIEALRSFEKIEHENIDVTILCSILKQYITKYLNGMLSPEVASSLYKEAKKGTKGRLNEMISLLPFILSNTEILFLKRLFELFKVIDENYKITVMPIDSLLSLFSLVLFPQGTFVKLEDLLIAKKIMFGIYECDFETVPSFLIPSLM